MSAARQSPHSKCGSSCGCDRTRPWQSGKTLGFRGRPDAGSGALRRDEVHRGELNQQRGAAWERLEQSLTAPISLVPGDMPAAGLALLQALVTRKPVLGGGEPGERECSSIG